MYSGKTLSISIVPLTSSVSQMMTTATTSPRSDGDRGTAPIFVR